MNPRRNLPLRQRQALTPEERQAERARRYWWGIARPAAILVGLIVLAVAITRRSLAPQVLSVVPARSLDDAFRPVEPTQRFSPDETFFVSVELRGYRPGMDLSAVWRYEGQMITRTPLATDDAGDGYAGFVLSPENPPEWPPGRYTVDILYGEKLLGRAVFEVVPDRQGTPGP